MNQTIIDGIGNSLKYWANYIWAVKRDKIINEGAIKYGISEYLVASENMMANRLAIGQPEILNVQFEQTHKVFKRKRTDLHFDVIDGNKRNTIFFEFKYLRELPLPRHEINRYINDFFRLAALSKLENTHECFFMLMGSPIQISEMLTQSYDNRMRINELPTNDHQEIIQCLSLKLNCCCKIKLSDYTDQKKELHLDRFHNDYLYRDDIEDQYKLQQNDVVKITLKYMTPVKGPENIGVYIWEIGIN